MIDEFPGHALPPEHPNHQPTGRPGLPPLDAAHPSNAREEAARREEPVPALAGGTWFPPLPQSPSDAEHPDSRTPPKPLPSHVPPTPNHELFGGDPNSAQLGPIQVAPDGRRRHRRRGRSLGRRWILLVSVLLTAGSLAGMISLLTRETTATDRPEAIGERVSTPAELSSFLKRAYPKNVPLVAVPTGLYVKSIQFNDSNTVTISGYVWQRYSRPLPKGLVPGVAFPEAVNSYDLTEVYRDTKRRSVTIGWHFEVDVREKFDYRQYPLDRQDVWLRMWHSDFDGGALLVPDLAGYPPWDDQAFLGVDHETVFDEWVPNYTFFSYNKIGYDASFGYGKFMGETGRPEMYFNMGFKRGVYGAFIGNLIPMIIVSLIMFGSLFPGSIDPEHAEATGFNTVGVVSFTVTMLLVAVFQHISIRSAVGGGALSYLDYLMFALYTVILLVTVNAILIRSMRPPRWITAHNNLAAKVLYWPVLLGLALTATILTFT